MKNNNISRIGTDLYIFDPLIEVYKTQYLLNQGSEVNSLDGGTGQ